MITPTWLVAACPSGPLATVEIDWALSNRNDGRGYHWRRTHRERMTLDAVVRAAEVPPQVPFTTPVVLVVVRVIPAGGRRWDECSVGRGNAKELIDAMVAGGWFHDDSPKWIRHVVWCQDARTRPDTAKIGVQIWPGHVYEETEIAATIRKKPQASPPPPPKKR